MRDHILVKNVIFERHYEEQNPFWLVPRRWETTADRSQRQRYRATIQWNKTLTEEETWKWRMMVHINPRVSLGFPSAMSSFLMLTNLTWQNKTPVILFSEHRQVSCDKAAPLSGHVPKGFIWSKTHTCRCLRKSSAICTFCSLWNRMRPFSLGWEGDMGKKGVQSDNYIGLLYFWYKDSAIVTIKWQKECSVLAHTYKICITSVSHSVLY